MSPKALVSEEIKLKKLSAPESGFYTCREKKFSRNEDRGGVPPFEVAEAARLPGHEFHFLLREPAAGCEAAQKLNRRPN